MPDASVNGPILDATVITGAKAGIADSVATVQGTVNNAFFVELLIMYIGFFIVMGLIGAAIGLKVSGRFKRSTQSAALSQNNNDYAIMHAKSRGEFNRLTGNKYKV